MAMAELFSVRAPHRYVQVGTGLLIDGKPVPSGVRVHVPDDIAQYIERQRWGHIVERPHLMVGRKGSRGHVFDSFRYIPGAGVSVAEWPNHMRPTWMRPDGRVKRAEGLRAVVPVVCETCGAHGYARKRIGARRAPRGDAYEIVCARCEKATRPTQD